MSAIKIAAVVLIVAGVLGLVYGNLSYTKATHKAKLGPIELSVKDKETVNVPVWAGVGAIALGGVLLLWKQEALNDPPATQLARADHYPLPLKTAAQLERRAARTQAVSKSRVADLLPVLGEAIEELHDAGFLEQAAQLDSVRTCAYTMSSELLGEVGSSILSALAAVGSRMPRATEAKLRLCLSEIEKVWPHIELYWRHAIRASKEPRKKP